MEKTEEVTRESLEEITDLTRYLAAIGVRTEPAFANLGMN